MFTEKQKTQILKDIVEKIEIPDYAYEKATSRYEDLGKWFDRDESFVREFSPHIFPQGSFRLGTAIRPLDESESYDLDLGCELGNNVTMQNCTQKKLKEYIKGELETYRNARGIKNVLEEKHRCWRLEYQDELNFHMDVVPCIPSDTQMKGKILEAIKKNGEEETIATLLAKCAVRITDNTHPEYDKISECWQISNPIGYAKWFEFRMRQRPAREARAVFYNAKVDDIPEFERKTVLQRVVQILKRHRDFMFRGADISDLKPISIIITTLAARAYLGEENISEALINVLLRMGKLVNPRYPKVPNPVNPAEDFADGWKKNTLLEINFNYWITQARLDFDNIMISKDADKITEFANMKMSVRLDPFTLNKRLGLSYKAPITDTSPGYVISNPHKPWGINS